eukprot:CAMPEP_0113597296 /NCGR_PEP_ID=MMETSP0015_2-20120614/40923_1 /TAXON_ID=2838 /ORGANISM="Odontella" /LENGTH=66 /DNA_ID=CAMNT_0000505127 /DNA_START=14 /DNA_END=210 /DNA_ORIENTATION=- /assembly_acc=CAM_ASM_000160
MIYGGWDPCADVRSQDDENDGEGVEGESGGSDEETIFHDCFLLDTDKWSWRPGPRPKYLSSRGGIL